MKESGLTFQVKSDRADPNYSFPSRFGENGEIIYSVPIEISSSGAFGTLGITIADCSLLTFGDHPILVYYYETTDKTFAFDQRKWLNRHQKREERYTKRYSLLEERFATEEGVTVIHTDHPFPADTETGYAQVEAEDLCCCMIEYVRRRYPKNGLYAAALTLYLKKEYGVREIGEALAIQERTARYYLDQAKAAAGEYFRKFCSECSDRDDCTDFEEF